MSENQNWRQRSLNALWHPCTQMRDHEGGADAQIPLIPIRHAEGVWLEDFDGKRYLDAVSSWWTNIFGHRHPHIRQAIKDQLEELDHVIFAGFTHAPAVELAERLSSIVPPGLTRCYLADNGSTAVEVALKLSFHYWRNQGQPERTRYIALTNGYHGETLGALAVGDTGLYRDTYAPLLMQPIYVQSPDAYDRADGDSWEDHARKCFTQMEAALEQHASEVCAVILEPLLQCAGGMRMHHPVYLSLLREACDRHGVHLITDEIATGFGRTGTLFACEQADISPDFICLSKGLTAGTLPLAAVLTGNEIYQAFYADYRDGKAFLHSHSYTGNPLLCRTALATLDVFEQDDWMARNSKTAALMAEGGKTLAAMPNVAEVRQTGMVMAAEMTPGGDRRRSYPATERRGLRVYRHALSRGVLLRPLGNVVYFMPPYVITPDEIELMMAVAAEGIELATRE
ncbi:MAG: adenosylmethionine--8-amino-7-oxononanoate transaminase [Panacagrimonas sp.]